jgi:hypothetical protein
MDDEQLRRRLIVTWLALALLMALPVLARATTVVVLAGDDFLVIAMGGRSTIVGGLGPDLGCKIHHAGDVFFGSAEIPGLGGDVARVIVEELRYGRRTAEERVVRASEAAKAFLLEEVGRLLRADAPGAYREIVALDDGLVVAGFVAAMLEGSRSCGNVSFE